MHAMTRMFCLATLLWFPIVSFAFTPAEMTFIRQVMTDIQRQSLDRNREFCGYFGYINGTLAASRIKRGWRASCRPPVPPRNMDVVASFHSHGRFDLRYSSEIPSSDDILSDHIEDIDGFMVTPGGRLWFIDGQSKEARIICGLDCLPKDPSFEPDPTIPAKNMFTLQELQDLEE